MEKLLQTKKEIRRIEWATIEKLIVLLYYNHNIKKTKIAMKGNMSYDKCVLYLDWMEMMDLIVKEIDPKRHMSISLSDHGRELFHKKFKGMRD